jgi:hypothetical protein
LLSGWIQICATCTRIEDEEGNWKQMDRYIEDRSEAEFTHGICPQCFEEQYPEIYKKYGYPQPGETC